LLAGLLGLSVLVFGTGLQVSTRVHDTADEVRARTVPAIGEIAAAKSALLRADRGAITSFTSGGAQLSGPGDEFGNQIAVASQSLARVAEHNMAGETGSSLLQLVEGMVVSYTGMIEQADAHFRQPGGESLGAVDLWNASRLLHRPDGALVSQLDALSAAQREALDRQVAGTAMTPGVVLLVYLPALALLVLLVLANVVFFRRFRRRVNLWLVLAAAALVALTVIAGRVAGSHQDLETTRTMLYQLVDDQRARDDGTDVSGQRDLRDLVVRTACGTTAACGDTLARFTGAVASMRDDGPGISDGALATETRTVTEQAASATAGAGLRPLMYVLAFVLAAAILSGFGARLNEYRYRR
jgi:hypothetical protein